MVGKFYKGRWIEQPCNQRKMNPNEKYDFIFSVENPLNPQSLSRFDEIASIPFKDIEFYIECLLQKQKSDKENVIKVDSSIGINSIPILCFSQIQLVSDFCHGIQNQSSSDSNNVEKFIKKYFPEGFNQIPRILWDGLRNGMMHQFYPKSYKFKSIHIKISCYVNDYKLKTHVYRNKDVLVIAINSIQLAEICKTAIYNYETELKKDEELQNCFIKAYYGFNNPDPIKESSDKAKEINNYLSKAQIDIRKNLIPIYIE